MAEALKNSERDAPDPRRREPVLSKAPERASTREPEELRPGPPALSHARSTEPLAPRGRPNSVIPPRETESSGGRGGPQHRYLQSLIKHYGEEKGFRATLEAPTTDGGRIDILLDNGKLSIACEISIGSSPAQEIANLQKCLRGEFVRVALISPERRNLKTIAAVAETAISETDRSRISFVTPDEFLALLDEVAQSSKDREATVLGYRVKTSIKSLDPDARESRKDSVLQTILRSLKRVKDRDSA
jgi:hypothetical protein